MYLDLGRGLTGSLSGGHGYNHITWSLSRADQRRGNYLTPTQSVKYLSIRKLELRLPDCKSSHCQSRNIKLTRGHGGGCLPPSPGGRRAVCRGREKERERRQRTRKQRRCEQQRRRRETAVFTSTFRGRPEDLLFHPGHGAGPSSNMIPPSPTPFWLKPAQIDSLAHIRCSNEDSLRN